MFALSLIVYFTRCGRPVTIEGAHDYMEVIGLDSGGIQPDQMRKSEFLATMEGYSRKTYIPIVSFPAQAGKVPS